MSEPRTRAKATIKFGADPLQQTEEYPRPTLALALLMAAVVACGLHALFISGPATRVAAEEQHDRTIAEENREVCGRLGISPDTAQFTICSGELAVVRRRQTDRDEAAAMGVL
jgi:hypothetical protein